MGCNSYWVALSLIKLTSNLNGCGTNAFCAFVFVHLYNVESVECLNHFSGLAIDKTRDITTNLHYVPASCMDLFHWIVIGVTTSTFLLFTLLFFEVHSLPSSVLGIYITMHFICWKRFSLSKVYFKRMAV